MKRLLPILLIAATPAAAHDPISWNGSDVHILLERDATGGDMGMFTTRFPGPGGPPRHVHEDAGEAFYVLDGAAEFLNDGARVTLEAGEAAYVPKGADHTFRVIGEGGGQILVVVTPGGFEGFFEATRHLKLPDQIEELNRISADFGQVFTGPPLEAE